MRATLERALTWLLAGALLVAVAGTVIVAVYPPATTEPYTEFYVLGADGNASDYGTELAVGETGTVVVGVSNFERRSMDYVVVARMGNRTVTERSLSLAQGETWEDDLSFTPDRAGRQRLRLLLYTGSTPDPSGEPYRGLRLWVNATAA